MNYLAHLLLAKNTPASLIGNLAGDFVKGRLTGQWGTEIEAGIAMHRSIDAYTDQHPVIRKSCNRISPSRRRYAPIIIDICFDYYLSQHWARYSTVSRDVFIKQIHKILIDYHQYLPGRLKATAPRLIEHQVLDSYTTLDGLSQACYRTSTRLKHSNPMVDAIEEIHANHEELESDFLLFFPDVLAFSKNKNKR